MPDRGRPADYREWMARRGVDSMEVIEEPGGTLVKVHRRDGATSSHAMRMWPRDVPDPFPLQRVLDYLADALDRVNRGETSVIV